MEFVNEFDKIIYEVSSVLGKSIDKGKYQIVDRGMPHQPKSLPKQKMGVYTFWYNGKFIKIGKAGPKSNARFESQHYNPKSSKSNLAALILSDERMKDKDITENNIGDWIKNNCRRVDILLDWDLGIFSLELIEAALHYKYEPVYEGFVTQR
ncbi:MAG: hypothetical protein E7C05_07530 [Clostridium botulinum]|uniref:hypothetical protein n=1 Tax=Clostridium TaxID=1485 RepID=UPI000ADBB445|nr:MULTISPECIES: hypothetical protein [Clostridium]MDU2832404.1 hypothetical protein [Clostridium botulinum]MDU5118191.1 hypothetical protein [Clostridium botulinum]